MEPTLYALMARLEDAHWWWRARREVVASVLDAWLPPATDREVLEVGCGSGGNLPMLARYGRVLGAEASPEALRLHAAHASSPYPVVRHAIPQPLGRRFDLVAMLDVLEHIDDDAGALRWLAAHLTATGRAILTVPALPALWSAHDHAAHHRRRYTLRSLTARLPPTLRVVHASYFNTLLLPPVALARWALALLPRRLQGDGLQLTLPPAPLNQSLHALFGLERHLVPRVRLPLGVSLLVLLAPA